MIEHLHLDIFELELRSILFTRNRDANGRLARKKWQYLLGEECSFGILSRAGRAIPSNSSSSSIVAVVVLGGVFRGFGGGNQSGKKLNITPEKRGRASFGNLGVSSVRWRSTTERNGLEGGRLVAGRCTRRAPTGIQDK